MKGSKKFEEDFFEILNYTVFSFQHTNKCNIRKILVNTDGNVYIKLKYKHTLIQLEQKDDTHYITPCSLYTIRFYEAIYRILYKGFTQQDISPCFAIHHIDGNHKNNRLDNLIKLSKSEHTLIHIHGNPYKSGDK